jgi:two-component system chemotaxis sensor kinase CheA
MLTDAQIMAQVLATFQEEQAEHREAIAQLLLELEQLPAAADQALVDRLFREAHSLKGGARAAGQIEVEQIAHAMEDLFSAVRQGQLELTPAICDPIYAAIGAIGAIMAQVAAGEPVDSAAYAGVMLAMSAGLDGQTPAAERAGAATPAGQDEGAPAESGPAARPDLISVRISVATLDSLLNETGELMAYTVRANQRTRQTQELTDVPTRWRRTARQVRPIVARLESMLETIQPTVHHLEGRQGFAHTRTGREQLAGMFAERDVSALVEAFRQADSLIGGLQRRLTAHIRESSEDQARLSTVTSRLHDQIRRTRMLPLATILSPLRLQVREMARAAAKQVHLVVDDGEAEADRQVLEALSNVVLHLLRNAVDHGVEAPAARSAVGKPPEGRVSVISRVSGDRLRLEIEDDGAGIDLQAVRQRALKLGMAPEADLHALGDDELMEIIFRPGFSTRPTVNTLSGRGVGLDIVRAQIQRIQGHISVRSVPGRGCRFSLSVPLSLTSAQSLLVRVGQEQYVLPLDAVQQILTVQATDVCVVEGRPTIKHQGKPTLLIHLADLLERHGPRPLTTLFGAQAGLVVLLGAGERQIAGMIDAVLGEQELVIHRLPPPLSRVRYVSSATILADGAVVPIIDVADVIRGALGLRHALPAQVAEPAAGRVHRVLVVDDSLTTRTLQKNILESAGYAVTLAADGVEALATLRAMAAQDGCDVLLSDIDMPRLNGFELTSQVRADAQLEHLPIILVTSLDTAADRERGIAAGADAYIVKRNFDQQVLLDTIKQLI